MAQSGDFLGVIARNYRNRRIRQNQILAWLDMFAYQAPHHPKIIFYNVNNNNNIYNLYNESFHFRIFSVKKSYTKNLKVKKKVYLVCLSEILL